MVPWTHSKYLDPFTHICPLFLYPWAVEKPMNTNGHLILRRSTPSLVWNLGDLAAWLTRNQMCLWCHEAWSLREEHYIKLESFLHRSIRNYSTSTWPKFKKIISRTRLFVRCSMVSPTSGRRLQCAHYLSLEKQSGIILQTYLPDSWSQLVATTSDLEDGLNYTSKTLSAIT